MQIRRLRLACSLLQSPAASGGMVSIRCRMWRKRPARVSLMKTACSDAGADGKAIAGRHARNTPTVSPDASLPSKPVPGPSLLRRRPCYRHGRDGARCGIGRERRGLRCLLGFPDQARRRRHGGPLRDRFRDQEALHELARRAGLQQPLGPLRYLDRQDRVITLKPKEGAYPGTRTGYQGFGLNGYSGNRSGQVLSASSDIRWPSTVACAWSGPTPRASPRPACPTTRSSARCRPAAASATGRLRLTQQPGRRSELSRRPGRR